MTKSTLGGMDLLKIAGSLVAAIVGVLAVMSFLGLGPAAFKAEEGRLTRLEIVVEQNANAVSNLTEGLRRLERIVDRLPPDDFEARMEYVEKFLTRHYPQEFHQ